MQGVVGLAQAGVLTEKKTSGPGLARRRVTALIRGHQNDLATSQGLGRRAIRLRLHVDATRSNQGAREFITSPESAIVGASLR